MANISKQKREEFIAKIEALKQKEAIDDTDRLLLNDIINELNEKRYGLVWEQHSEAVDDMMVNNIPVFTEDKDKKIVSAPDLPYNFLLEGDNLHSLKLLEKTHKGKIDVIYIDPPYNTGNKDFIYEDRMVGKDDGYRHSKWLSFMNERLKIAKKLLSQQGVIFISIDDNEYGQLKILCDSIYNEENFVANIIWAKNSGNNNSVNVSIKTEYVLVYGNDKKHLGKSFFFQRKESFDDILALVKKCKDNGMTPEEAQAELRNYYLKNKNIPNGTKQYKYVDDEFRIFRISNLGNPSDTAYQKPEYTYDYINPLTGEKCEIPKRGWLYKKKDLDKKVAENIIYFKAKVPQLKRYLDSVEYENVSSLLINNDLGNRDLEGVINEKSSFSYPKPISLIKKCISCNSNKDITVLDFFAGSGTTGQAVMDLNMEDGGSRKFILCTNNENNICEDVTYQRLKTVITGIRKDGSKYSDGISANLKYYKTDFVSKISKDEDYYIEDKITQHIKEMIELENAVEIDNDKYVLLLTDEEVDAFEQDMKNKNLKKVYIDSTIMLSGKALSYLDDKKVEVIPIPDYYFHKDINAG